MVRSERQLSLTNAFLFGDRRRYRPQGILFAVHFNYAPATAICCRHLANAITKWLPSPPGGFLSDETHDKPDDVVKPSKQ